MQAYPLMWNECAFDTIRTPGVSVSAVTLRVEPDCSGQRICSQIIYVNFSFLPSTPLPVRAKPIENQTRGRETAENRTIRYRAWHELRQTQQAWGLVVGIDRWLLATTTRTSSCGQDIRIGLRCSPDTPECFVLMGHNV